MSITTWNPADKGTNITLALSNSQASSSSGTPSSVRSNNPKTTGKLYFEIWVSGAPATPTLVQFGVADGTTTSVEASLGDTGQVAWCMDADGTLFDNGVAGTDYALTLVNDDIIGVAVDLDNGYVYFLLNGALINGGSLPLDGTNYDLNTVTGTVHAAFTTASTEIAGTGKWLEADFGLAIPTGFTAWDAGAILPETITDSANATETTAFDGSSYSITETATAEATETTSGIKTITVTVTSEAGSTDTDTYDREVSLSASAAATSTMSGINSSVLTVTDSAAGTSTLGKFGMTAFLSATADASAIVSSVRGLSLFSVADATGTVTWTRTSIASMASNAAAVDLAALVMVANASSTAVVTETVTGIRRVTMTITDSAGSSSSAPALNNVAKVVTSEADATGTVTASLTATSTLTSEAEATDFVKLSVPDLAHFWTNPATGAAAVWYDLPCNSLVEVDGEVIGATPDGIVSVANGIDDDTAPVDSEVLWDLDDFGSPQKKRLGGVYVAAQGAGPFRVRVTNEQGTFYYPTRKPPSTKATNHRAVPGRGLESVYFRIGVESSKDYGADHVIVEHEQVARRI